MAKNRRKAPKSAHVDRYSSKPKPNKGKVQSSSNGPVDVEAVLKVVRDAGRQRAGFTQFADAHNEQRESSENTPGDPRRTGKEYTNSEDQRRLSTWPEYTSK